MNFGISKSYSVFDFETLSIQDLEFVGGGSGGSYASASSASSAPSTASSAPTSSVAPVVDVHFNGPVVNVTITPTTTHVDASTGSLTGQANLSNAAIGQAWDSFTSSVSSAATSVGNFFSSIGSTVSGWFGGSSSTGN